MVKHQMYQIPYSLVSVEKGPSDDSQTPLLALVILTKEETPLVPPRLVPWAPLSGLTTSPREALSPNTGTPTPYRNGKAAVEITRVVGSSVTPRDI